MKNSKKTTSTLCCFGICDYIILASSLALALGEELDSIDIDILSSFFAVLSDELALISSVKACGSSDLVVDAPPDVLTDDSGNSSDNNRISRKKSSKRRRIKKG